MKAKTAKLIPSLLAGLYLLSAAGVALAQDCASGDGVSLQVLGSGGPVADDARASSGYLVWHNGRARALVDLGGGALLRFAESGASFTDLDAVLLTHLHADHSADLPALLKSGYFAGRERSLVLAGPPGGGNDRVQFPSLEDYVTSLLQPGSGAYGYLGGYLDGSGGMPYLRLVMIESELDDEAAGDAAGDVEDDLDVSGVTLRDSELSITAIPVPHGPVPAVAYRVEVGGRALVFAGDQNGRRDDLEAFAAQADLLVLHMPIPEGAGPPARALHATPSRLGEIAAEAAVEQLLLSHFMARSLADLEGNVARVASAYAGDIHIAADLDCIAVP